VKESAFRQEQSTFQFGVFELNPQTRELRKHGVKLKIQDQPLQILTLLLEHPGEIVTRERRFKSGSGLKIPTLISITLSIARYGSCGMH